MNRRTALYDEHVALKARMVDFAGWDMPVHYGSQLEEHHAVRRDAGMFDVSHMCIVDLHGAGVRDYLRVLLANNVDKLTGGGAALYSCMLNAQGGVIDDLIVYFVEDDWFRAVVNAGTRDKDLQWMRAAAQQSGGVEVRERDDLAMIAVQGPRARERVFAALGPGLAQAAADLSVFHAVRVGELFVARTGYTGEDGFEIMLPAVSAPFTWRMLMEQGVAPAGLGARDTLRLEAGMNLYGADMDETTTPLVSGLAWTVAWEPETRRFIGRDALEKQRAAGVPQRLVGLLLDGPGVLRSHQRVVFDGLDDGVTTSGSFAPTLGQSVALARVPAAVATKTACRVEIRGKLVDAHVVKYPFVRNGRSLVD